MKMDHGQDNRDGGGGEDKKSIQSFVHNLHTNISGDETCLHYF